jgi:hypothetical protein
MSFDLDSDDQHFLDAMHLHRRHLSEEQLRRYEGLWWLLGTSVR